MSSNLEAQQAASYIAHAVELVKKTDLPGHWHFEIQCVTDPHAYNDLKIEFRVWYAKSSEWITGPTFEDAIEEHLRRHAIRNKLSPLCLPRTTYGHVPDVAMPGDEIPF